MTGPPPDALDLKILYDAARGFLEARGTEARTRYALLSLVGASGASFAVWLDRDGDRLEPALSRGDAAGVRALTVTRKLETALAEAPRPPARRELGALGGAASAWVKRCGVEMLAPVFDDGGIAGVFALGPRLFGDPYSDREVDLASAIVGLAASARGLRTRPRPAVRPAADAGPSRSRAEALRAKHPALAPFRGDSAATAELFRELIGLAEFDLPVLVLGETGTGKELVARAVHDLGGNTTGTFEAINCAAIPRELMASTLFGHERGAFTGAVSRTRGAFERAGRGTIFLDEIGDMPAETQASLLRVLQEGTFTRVGGEEPLPARARVVSATNCDLAEAVAEKRFRADLFYRLQMFCVRIPPLRERREDVAAIAGHVLERHAPPRGRRPVLSRGFLRALGARELPGNARELESLLVGALVKAGRSGTLEAEHLPAPPARTDHPPAAAPAPGRDDPPEREHSAAGRAPQALPERPDDGAVPSYESMERQYIRTVLDLTEGNKKEAAALMGIPRTTLNARMKKLGLASG